MGTQQYRQHPTVSQNQAHRDDLNWFKTARGGEYMNSDGYVIRKNVNTSYWEVFAPDGTRATYSHTRDDGTETPKYPIGGHSLTFAKYDVKHHIYEQDNAS